MAATRKLTRRQKANRRRTERRRLRRHRQQYGPAEHRPALIGWRQLLPDPSGCAERARALTQVVGCICEHLRCDHGWRDYRRRAALERARNCRGEALNALRASDLALWKALCNELGLDMDSWSPTEVPWEEAPRAARRKPETKKLAPSAEPTPGERAPLPRLAIRRWSSAASPAGFAKHERGSVVTDVRLDLDEAHEEIFANLETRMTRAVGSAIEWIRDRLAVRMEDDPTGRTKRQRLHVADLELGDAAVADSLQKWITELIGEEPGPAHIVKSPTALRIAWGGVEEKEEKGEVVQSWVCHHLHPKFQLQQFFLHLLPADIPAVLPGPLRAGMTQEVGQQLCSHLMLADSGTVALAAYPTAESRDPAARRAGWEAALRRVERGVSPFPYERARDLDPRTYGPDDPAGDRLVNTDPNWRVVVKSPEPRRARLLFVRGDDILLYRRVWQERVSRTGGTSEVRARRATYAAIPVDEPFLAPLDPELREAAEWWKRDGVRETFARLLPKKPTRTRAADEAAAKGQPQKPTRKRPEPPDPDTRKPLLLVPLAYGRARTEQQVLAALTRLPIQWARLVHRMYRRPRRRRPRQWVGRKAHPTRRRRRGKWFLQLTVAYAAPKPFPKRVLGIHFALENVYYWALVEDRGVGEEPRLIEESVERGNPILALGMPEKDDLERAQLKGKWVGGRVYRPALKGATHTVVDRILALALRKGTGDEAAGLGVENIRWVQKGEGPPEANRLHSAWDYAQLRDSLKYKAPPAGVWATIISLKKEDQRQDHAEQARRLARESIRRLHERQRRAKEAG